MQSQAERFEVHCKALDSERNETMQRLYNRIIVMGSELERAQDTLSQQVGQLQQENQQLRFVLRNERTQALNSILKRMGASASDVMYLLQVLESLNGHLLK
jgi:flagellar basal body P-ring protein FlgI